VAPFSASKTRHLARRLASPLLFMYNPNHLDQQGLAMLERERRKDQADRLVILPTASGHSGRGGGLLPVGS